MDRMIAGLEINGALSEQIRLWDKREFCMYRTYYV